MSGTRRCTPPRLALPAALLLAGAAQGQTAACEQLKARLAAGIESSGVRGYALEVVPVATPMPRGGKVIGNCEGGAYKVVYQRWASTAPAVAPVAPPPPPPPPPPAPAPSPLATPTPSPAPAPRPSAARSPASAPQPEPAAATPWLQRHWPWVAGAIVLVGGGWLWRSRFSAYDKNGLPRGPRL